MVKDLSSLAGEDIGIMYDHTESCGFLCLNFLLARKQIKAFPYMKKFHKTNSFAVCL